MSMEPQGRSLAAPNHTPGAPASPRGAKADLRAHAGSRIRPFGEERGSCGGTSSHVSRDRPYGEGIVEGDESDPVRVSARWALQGTAAGTLRYRRSDQDRPKVGTWRQHCGGA